MIAALCRNARTGCEGPPRDDLSGCGWGAWDCCHGVATHGELCAPCAAGATPTAARLAGRARGAAAASAQRAREAARPIVGRAPPPTRGALGLPPLRPERAPRASRETPEARVTRESMTALERERLLLGRDEHGMGVKIYRNNRGIAKTPGGGRVAYGVGENGTADFVGRLCPSGLWCSLEMKAPGEEPSDTQWRHIHEVRLDGGWADWSDSAERTVRLVREALAWAARGRT